MAIILVPYTKQSNERASSSKRVKVAIIDIQTLRNGQLKNVNEKIIKSVISVDLLRDYVICFLSGKVTCQGEKPLSKISSSFQ